MCGRFTLRTPLKLLAEYFDAEASDQVQLDLFGPRYNIAPTQQVLIVREALDRGRELTAVRWGLVPSWSKAPTKGPPLINARSETVTEKPSFRSAIKRRRCLLLADGFYEWQANEAGQSSVKQPFFIHYPDDRPFAFAAIWERWKSSSTAAADIESCALVNTAAEGWMTDIHHRMPIILDPADHAFWLDSQLDDPQQLKRLFAPRDYPELEARPVSTHVNRVKNDDRRCVASEPRLFD